VSGRADETPIGWIPAAGALDTAGTNVTPARLAEALRCDSREWLAALDDLGQFYGEFGPRLPQPITQALAATRRRLGG